VRIDWDACKSGKHRAAGLSLALLLLLGLPGRWMVNAKWG
jgi:hypothetical protein